MTPQQTPEIEACPYCKSPAKLVWVLERGFVKCTAENCMATGLHTYDYSETRYEVSQNGTMAVEAWNSVARLRSELADEREGRAEAVKLVYTKQIATARNEALEEAAKVADKNLKSLTARRIRSLQSSTTKEKNK